MKTSDCFCGHEKQDHRAALTGTRYGACKVFLCGAFLKPTVIAVSPPKLVPAGSQSRGRRSVSLQATMKDADDLVELAKLEDDLWLLEQQAKHVISGLGRPSAELAKRVETLHQASALYAEIRRIREKVHELRGT